MDLEARIHALPQELQDQILFQTLLDTLPPLQHFYLRHDAHYYEMSSSPHPATQYAPSSSRSSPFDLLHRKFRKDGETVYELVPNQPIHRANVTHIDRDYKPPAALQINRKTRYAMAQIYYRNRVFFSAGLLWSKWDCTLIREHHKMIEQLVDRDPNMHRRDLEKIREERPGDVWIESTWSGDQADLRTPGRWAVQDEANALFFEIPPEPLDMEIQSLPQNCQDLILHHKLVSMFPLRKKLTWTDDVYLGCEWEICRLDRYNRMQQRFSADEFGLRGGKPSDNLVVPIDLDYKPPIALQINRKIRHAMVQSYYRDTLFYTDSAMLRGVDEWDSTRTSKWTSKKTQRLDLKNLYRRRYARKDWLESIHPAYRKDTRVISPRSNMVEIGPERFLDGVSVSLC